MKTKHRLASGATFMLTTCAVLFLTSCNSNQAKHKDLTQEFKLVANKADGIYVISSSIDDAHTPRRLTYIFNGTMTNRGGNIYAKAAVKIKVFLELNNGQVLEDSQLEDNPVGGIKAFQAFDQIMPSDSEDIDGLVSWDIPIAYVNYPVQRVYVDFILETEDQVNNQNASNIILEKDLTDSWRAAAFRAKLGKADADDVNYREKIIGVR